MTRKSTDKKTKKIQLRLSEFQLNRLKMRASRFASGNLSQYLLTQALNAPILEKTKGRSQPR